MRKEGMHNECVIAGHCVETVIKSTASEMPIQCGRSWSQMMNVKSLAGFMRNKGMMFNRFTLSMLELCNDFTDAMLTTTSKTWYLPINSDSFVSHQ